MSKRIFFAIFSFVLTLGLSAQTQGQGQILPIQKLNFAEQLIEKYYVDSVDSQKIVTEAITAMLKTLDPHSTYTSPDETRELNESLGGNFSGIGIRFQMLSDTLYVIEAVSGGPSERVGILPGDRIIECNDTVIAGVKMKNTDIMKILRGPKGTEARLSVKRKGVPEPIEFRVTRDDIPIYSVESYFMINDSTGYVSISRFAETTTDELSKALKELRRKGMRHLVLDLTENGGGYMRPATEISDMFLRQGAPVVYTEAPKIGRSEYITERDGEFTDGRLVVMVNQYSASASEILSGAIQDNDRGVIVGRRTFGKGLVQRPFPFPDGSMIRLTVSRYHTPSGRCIQKPYTDGADENYSHDIINRYNSGEFTSADSAKHFSDSLRYYTLRNHRPVYGGGGIMPDRFVAIDTTMYSTYYRDLVAKGSINGFSVDYVDTNRATLKSLYPDAESFIAGFEITPEISQALKERGEKDGVVFDEEQFSRSKPIIYAIVKGLIGRDIFDQSIYSRIVLPLDPIYQSAVATISDPVLYDSLLAPTDPEPEKPTVPTTPEPEGTSEATGYIGD